MPADPASTSRNRPEGRETARIALSDGYPRHIPEHMRAARGCLVIGTAVAAVLVAAETLAAIILL
jgi:hypothetical protein